jgi:NDP-sugar pyrophosphorylase family protein
MQIVIPMSGFGERFRRAGYAVPKPLIEIDGKPIIGHVIDMFPGEREFLFICNEDHLADPAFRMEAILREYCPTGKVVGIPAHKLGPVHAVRQAEHLIDPKRPVVVNYCDFTCYWNWRHFKQFVAASRCDGAIPAYKGFHPHSLGSTNYAYLRETGGWISDIQEKQPFTANRMDEYASSGTYYFATGALMNKAFRATMDQGLNVGGEHYVSLAYKPLFAEDRPVAIYPLQHFMQWGTPEDVAEYRNWSAAFRRLAEMPASSARRTGSIVIPMAGLGQRFANEGYTVTKPLIPVSAKPMVVQAACDLPAAQHHCFVLRADMPGQDEVAGLLKQTYPGAVIKSIPSVTEGQACTALLGLNALEASHALSGEAAGPLTFGACDNGALYDPAAFDALAGDPDTDVIVWGARGHANAVRNPKMYGWIDAEKDGAIRRISVKTPLASPSTDPIVLGTFTFKRADDFRRAVARLIGRDGRVNGEFYIDSCINDAIEMGLRCRLFEVDSYLSWGTPDDLRTYEYWQSCFHQWDGHPYRLEKDSRIRADSIAHLEERYRAPVPPPPMAIAKRRDVALDEAS